MKSVTCVGTRILGKDGKHHRVMLEDTQSNTTFECVMWNTRGNVPADRQVVDAVFTPEINVFNNKERLQLVLSDWRDSKSMVFAPAPVAVSVPNAVSVKKVVGIADYAPSKPNVVAEALVSNDFSPTGANAPASVKAPTSGYAPATGNAQASVNAPASGNAQASVNAPTPTDASEGLTASGDFAPGRDFSSHSSKLVWKDLRSHLKAAEILAKAVEKLGNNVSIFAESSPKQSAFEFVDRMTVGRKQHLIIWQTPPSSIVFQELLSSSGAQTIYLVGVPENEDAYDSNSFLKKLFGLVKYAVNKKDGQVEGEKLAAVLACTKMSVALGLTILKKVNLIDWFSESGFINLDLLGPATGNAEELPEFKQLVLSLKAAKEFKDWCSSASLKDIQLAVMPNHIGLGSQADALELLQSDDEEEMEQANEYPSGQEQVGEVKPSA